MRSICFCLALAAAAGSSSCYADVLPAQAGVYVGTISTVSAAASAPELIKDKDQATLILDTDGTMIIVSEKSINTTATATTNLYHGVARINDSFLQGSFALHFGKNGSLKGTLNMGVVFNENTAISVEGKFKFKKQVPF